MSGASNMHEKFLKEYDLYKKQLIQYAEGPMRERRLAGRQIRHTAKRVQELFHKLVESDISKDIRTPNKISPINLKKLSEIT